MSSLTELKSLPIHEQAYTCYLLLSKKNVNMTKQVLGTDYIDADDDNLRALFVDHMITDMKPERQIELESFAEKLTSENPFLYCICVDHKEKFQYNLIDFNNNHKVSLKWKPTCRDLLIDSVKIYCTPYKNNYYILKENNKLKYIGTDWESYLENLYSYVDKEFRELIPFSSFKSSIEKNRIYEKLEPNRDYLLFNDCLLNITTGTQLATSEISITTVPFAVIDADYNSIDHEANKFVRTIFKKIDDDNNTIKSILYGMFNKEVLGKRSAIFNIQKSGMGKTLLVKPFIETGLFANVNHEMLSGNDRIELFRQYYTVVFEEIQDTVINGSGFNSLIDNTSMEVQRKYKTAITVPKELKPVVYFNGESMVNFKGRTKGSFNRFTFIPNYKEKLTDADYDFIDNNPKSVVIETLRILIKYVNMSSIDVVKQNVQNAKKTEKEILELKENKLSIIFQYIKDECYYIPNNNTKYCISQKMLIELIKELQSREIITVNLFNDEGSIKRFIKNTLIPNIETDDQRDYTDSKNRKIVYKGKDKTARLKAIFELTEKGKNLIEDMGYVISKLVY